MARLVCAVLALAAAAAWLVYVHSLPGRMGPGKLLGDLSSLAIGVGVYRMVLFIITPSVTRVALPSARVR